MEAENVHQKGISLWQTLAAEGRCLCLGVNTDSFFADGATASNLWELLNVSCQPRLRELMLSFGVEEAYITGRASDYDKLLALARVLPLWSGHPYYFAIHELLARLFDLRLPLNEETLPHIWQRTAHLLAQDDVNAGRVLRMYGYDSVIHPIDKKIPAGLSKEGIKSRGIKDVTAFLSPYDGDFPNLVLQQQASPKDQVLMTWLEANAVAEMQDAASQGVISYTADLSQMQDFPRPHPYTSGEAYGKICRGEETTATENDLVTAQMLRCMASQARTLEGQLVLYGVKPAVYEKLRAYLAEQKMSLPTLCVAKTPEDAVALSRMGAKVAVEMDLYATDRQTEDVVTRMAAGLPIGCLAGLYLPVSGLADLPLADRVEKIFCGCLARFGECGMGPADARTQQRIANAVLRRTN